MLDITNLAIKTTFNPKMDKFKSKIPDITKLVNNAFLNAEIKYKKPTIIDIENKIPTITNLVKKNLIMIQKVMKLKKMEILIMINILLLHNVVN